MSTEYSQFHRDYSYKSSHKPNYRFNKYQQPKEVTIYAPKKQYYEDERDYDNSQRSYDNYDARDNSHSSYRGYKSKRYQKDTRTCNHGFHLWKKDFVVKSSNQPVVENTESKKEEEVSKEKKDLMNEGTCESDSSSGKSTNYVTEDSRKSLDTLPEDIQGGMKERMIVTTIDEILEETEGENVLKSESEKVKEKNQENDGVVSQETDESDEEKFSNIDLKVEKKLGEDEFDEIHSNDIFDENEERPIWEDVNTKQILEDIKKGNDFLSLYPQEMRLLNITENVYKTQENAEEDHHEEDEEEEEVEDLNTILALRVLERGFSRPSIEINLNGIYNNNYPESAKTDQGLPIVLESPISNFNGCQSAFLPQYRQQAGMLMSATTPYSLQTPVNRGLNKMIFKSFGQDYDANMWFYADSDGVMQGPFSSCQMDEWYSMGYLPLDLDINLKESKGFRKLREIANVVVNHEGDFLLNMNNVISWFNHYEMDSNNVNNQEEEEESYPPGIPISPRKIAAVQTKRRNIMEPQTAGLFQERVVPNRECVSASLMGPKRLAAFNVYNNKEELDPADYSSFGRNNVQSHNRVQNDFISSQSQASRNGSPLNSGISNHSFHNSPVNTSFNPSLLLPFPIAVNPSSFDLNQFKSPASMNNKQQPQDFTCAWKSFINEKN